MTDDFLYSLNPEQQNAVTHTHGPLLIIAGAGTGKTTAISHKIAYLIKNGFAKPNEILALTFTEKTGEEMQNRVDLLLHQGYLDYWIGTFHGFCERLLKRHAIDIGLPNEFHIATPTDAWMLMRKHLDRFSLEYYKPLGNPTKSLHALIRHFSRCKDEEISPEEYLAYAETIRQNTDTAEFTTEEAKRIEEIANAYHTYNQLLIDEGMLDFGDLIVYTLKLFRTRLPLLERCKKQFRYILVDEFQDTNWAQYALVKLLSHTPESNLTVVGDDNQSIYKFRGASVSNILQFSNDFPHATRVILTKNYRSTQNILDTAYQLIQYNNPDTLEVKLGIQKQLKGKQEAGTVEHLHYRTAQKEVNGVVQTIIELKNAHPQMLWKDIAILVRANNQAEPFLQMFRAHGVPYVFLAATGLFRQKLVLDLINYLRLLDNYHEGAALYRILTLPLWSLTDADRIELTHLARKKNWSLYGTLLRANLVSLSSEGRKGIEKLIGLVATHTRMAHGEPITKVLLAFLEDSGYLRWLTKTEDATRTQEQLRDLDYLHRFFEIIEAFVADHPEEGDIQSFLEYLHYTLEAGDEGTLHGLNLEEDSVQILTVHSAKGLEFRYVFVVNLVQARFPSLDRKETIELPDPLIRELLPEGDAHLQEERRLLYVAITRAKEGIFFTSADDYGGIRKKKPSQFLYEMGWVDAEGVPKNRKDSSTSDTESVPPAALQTSTTKHYRLPDRFSFSQLKAFETCPYQYKLAFILKVPTKGKAVFSFGQTMHSTLQAFYERMQQLNCTDQPTLFDPPTLHSDGALRVPPLSELIELYQKKWMDDWYASASQKEAYKKRGQEILKTYYTSQEGRWQIPYGLESWFTTQIGEYVVHGRIDRIDHNPIKGADIIDYKTGTPKDTLSAEDKEQLLLYQIALEESPKFRELEKVNALTYYYLESNTQQSFIGSTKEKERVKEKITGIIQEMQKSTFEASPSPFSCRTCDFKDICEFRQL